MKISILIIFTFFFISLTAFGQVGIFTGQAFLNIFSNKKVFIFKDSLNNQSIFEIHNNNKEDKYYLFDIQNKFKTRVKIISKYTKDAGNLDSSSIYGWIEINKLFVFYNKSRKEFQFVYNKANRHSGKRLIESKFLSKPLQILNIDFIKGETWFKVIINISKNRKITGWLPPEFQCNDIWNACEGN